MSEYQLNTSVLMMPYDDYMDEANEFLSHFNPVSTTFSEIQREAVMFSSLADVRGSLPQTGHTSGEYIRGLRICYGLTDDQIKLYYVPIYGDLESQDTDSVEFSLSETSGDLIAIITANTLPVYENIDGVLTDIMDNDPAKTNAIQSITDYRSDIRIILQDNESPSEYENGRDGKSIFFPFQEIDALQSEYDADIIYFTSTSKTADTDYKHFIVMSHLDPLNNATFNGAAANVAKLCPPLCDSVSYDIT